jgi:branched-chain amino acid transport system ATP-binding protein
VTPLFEVQALSAGYGDVRVLWDVGLAVHAGEIIALVGANGAGKTSLMRALAGLLTARSGRIALDGRDVTAAPPAARIAGGLALVPEGRRLFGAMSVKENLLMGAYVKRMEAEARLTRIYGYFPELGARADQLAGSLSGGEQQMCAIGRALMAEPRLLLIDEMSLGLAPIMVERLADIVRALNRDGLSVLLVEQDVYTALDLASRVVVLAGGRIVLEGRPGELVASEQFRDAYLLL